MRTEGNRRSKGYEYRNEGQKANGGRKNGRKNRGERQKTKPRDDQQKDLTQPSLAPKLDKKIGNVRTKIRDLRKAGTDKAKEQIEKLRTAKRRLTRKSEQVDEAFKQGQEAGNDTTEPKRIERIENRLNHLDKRIKQLRKSGGEGAKEEIQKLREGKKRLGLKAEQLKTAFQEGQDSKAKEVDGKTEGTDTPEATAPETETPETPETETPVTPETPETPETETPETPETPDEHCCCDDSHGDTPGTPESGDKIPEEPKRNADRIEARINFLTRRIKSLRRDGHGRKSDQLQKRLDQRDLQRERLKELRAEG